jgi:glyceraldehyde 3-phosphate dehydrogenase
MSDNRNLLGINGLGRIAKLTLWEHIRLKHFDGFVVNIGREVGTGT